ncbi:uncharacterized protein LOC142233293 [Haematobia irritans]|uniref:uncharacterized protein LOC142233293 n=1 Tax=Haematobia irritans TaxID=7368 RepID=UPI003F4FFDD5
MCGDNVYDCKMLMPTSFPKVFLINLMAGSSKQLGAEAVTPVRLYGHEFWGSADTSSSCRTLIIMTTAVEMLLMCMNIIQTLNTGVLLIQEKHKQIKLNSEKITSIHTQLRDLLINEDLKLFIDSELSLFNSQINKNKTTHRKKFENLLQQHNKEINIKFNEQWFVNTTNKHIPTNVQWLLSLGPKYSLSLTRAQFPLLKVIAEGEDLVRTTDDKEEQEIARTKFTTLIDDHLHKTNVNKRDKFILGTVAQTKKYLKNNKDVLILSADKGGKTVAMDSKEYKSKMHAILYDMCSYKRLKIDPTSKFQTKNNKLVEKLYKEDLISIEEKNKLTSKTAIAPRIYGLPKVHKEGTPLRPICSSINAPSYKMCRYISSILKNVTKDSKYNVKDAIDFKTKIKNVRLTDDEILKSFDVVSLFPSIQVNLAIAMIEKKWDLIKNHTKIPRDIFKELALFCIKDSRYFKYEDKTYEQLKGMPMGSPASPIIADIIMEELLDVSLSKIPKPRIITKYVDDIFAIVKKTDVESTLDALNSFHSQIQFTMELEKDNKLPYLDCNILRDAINFIDRILRISDAEFHKENEIKIRQILTTNDFPNGIISRLINRVKNKTLDENIKTKTIEEPDHNKDKSYKPMTYVEGFSERFFKSDVYNKDKIQIASRTSRTVKELFSNTKSQIKNEDRSNIVLIFAYKDYRSIVIAAATALLYGST